MRKTAIAVSDDRRREVRCVTHGSDYTGGTYFGCTVIESGRIVAMTDGEYKEGADLEAIARDHLNDPSLFQRGPTIGDRVDIPYAEQWEWVQDAGRIRRSRNLSLADLRDAINDNLPPHIHPVRISELSSWELCNVGLPQPEIVDAWAYALDISPPDPVPAPPHQVRFRYAAMGGHVHVKVFARSHDGDTWASAGLFTLNEQEWGVLNAALAGQYGVIVEEQGHE